MKNPVIIAAKRTAIGSMQGSFATLKSPILGAKAIAAAVDDAGIPYDDINEVFMGCVLSAGVGQAPARQASLGAGLSERIPTSTINKVCGSGMKTVMMASDLIAAGGACVVVAGGMENMTLAPYLNFKMRSGARLGHVEVKDHMFFDGLEDAYETGTLMGFFAEETASHYAFTRQAQDEYALRSLSCALSAQKTGAFAKEITPVMVTTRKGEITICTDEQPFKTSPEKIPTLRPAFVKNGTVTAANSSSISDGAAALVISDQEYCQKNNIPIRAQIVGYTSYAQEPAWFTTAPIPATQKLLNSIGWTIEDVDLWEVNEAFAVVPMAFMTALNIPHDRINVNGGACALGHPIGASGARIIVTLLHALEHRNLKRGIATICIGGGESTAIAIERL